MNKGFTPCDIKPKRHDGKPENAARNQCMTLLRKYLIQTPNGHLPIQRANLANATLAP